MEEYITFISETNIGKNVFNYVHDVPQRMGIPLLLLSFGSIFVGYIFKDMFWAKKDIDINQVRFTDGEVVDAKWVDINEFNNMSKLNQLASNMDFDLDKIKNIKF